MLRRSMKRRQDYEMPRFRETATRFLRYFKIFPKPVGRISFADDNCIVWTIDKFLSRHLRNLELNDDDDRQLVSEGSYLYDDFKISLYLREGLLMFKLTRKGRPYRRSMVSCMSLVGVGGKEHTCQKITLNDSKSSSEKWCIPLSDLKEKGDDLVPNDCLTICCKLRSGGKDPESTFRAMQEPTRSRHGQSSEGIEAGYSATETGKTFKWKEERLNAGVGDSAAGREEALKSKSVIRLQEDFKNLLNSGESSDVTIKVQEKEFPVHRGILQVRSPVFDSMFSHPMKENETGVVTIDDCEAETFSHFLHYVYTGNVQNPSPENLCSLYEVADKYCMEELQEECKEYMKNNFSVATFCDVLTLSLRHNETDLTDMATKFFCNRTTDILKTAKWQQFLNENTAKGNELMIKAFEASK